MDCEASTSASGFSRLCNHREYDSNISKGNSVMAMGDVEGGISTTNNYNYVYNQGNSQSVIDPSVNRQVPEFDLKECLRSLSFPDIDTRKRIIANSTADTGEWIFSSPQYCEWWQNRRLQDHHGVLWIKGKPGAGKSTLMKHILQHLVENKADSIIAAYFFNGRGSDLEKSPLGMLRSIIYQLIDQDEDMGNDFTAMFIDKRKKQDENVTWTIHDINELQRFLEKQMASRTSQASATKHYVLMLDALDECNEEDVRGVVQFLRQLSRLAMRNKFPLIILLSSRHYPHISMECSELNIDKESKHLKDIEIYIGENLWEQNPQFQHKVSKKANGFFQWAILVVAMLNRDYDGGNVRQLEQRLDELPPDLDSLFSKILTNGSQDRKSTVLMLQWVLFARRPLSPAELYFAVHAGVESQIQARDELTETDEVIQRFIKDKSKGLVEIVPAPELSEFRRERARVQFIHGTLIEFLLRHQRLQTIEPGLSAQPVGLSHDILAEICWRSILRAMRDGTHRVHSILKLTWLKPDESAYKLLFGRNADQFHPFLSYAMTYKWYHVEEAQKGSIPQENRLIELEMYAEEPFTGTAADKISWDSREILEGSPSFMYDLVYGGYEHILKLRLSMLDKGTALSEINAQGGKFGTALQAAVVCGKVDIVLVLLKAGADVNIQGGEFGTALQAAADRGKVDIVLVLLKAGADVNIQGGYHGTALQAAVVRGQVDLVRVLLEAGADVNLQGGYHRTALQAAVVRGQVDLVRVLLEAGADVNLQGGYHRTALQAAAARGKVDIVSVLLKAGADVNIQGGKFGTALHAAAARGKVDIVLVLLKAGADVNLYSSGQCGSALHAAVNYCRFAVEKLLREWGAVEGPGWDEMALDFDNEWDSEMNLRRMYGWDSVYTNVEDQYSLK